MPLDSIVYLHAASSSMRLLSWRHEQEMDGSGMSINLVKKKSVVDLRLFLGFISIIMQSS